MNILNHTKSILHTSGCRTMIHGRLSDSSNVLEPVKLAYASYEDTKTRDVKEKLLTPPVLIMHGLFGSKNNWSTICKALHRRTNPTRKIIAVDSRNHGDSTHSDVHNYPVLAVDVKNLLEVERIPKISFMGHSMGGRCAMYFALKYPELVERLIVCDISPKSNSKSIQQMIKYFGAMQSIQVPPGLALSTARAQVDAALMPTIPDKDVRSFLLTNLVQKPNGTVTWRLNLKALRDNYANISKFPIEINSGIQYTGLTTFIAGGNSDYIRPEDYGVIKKLFPNSVIHTIPGAGHWLHAQKPAEFIQLVLDALDKPILPSKTI